MKKILLLAATAMLLIAHACQKENASAGIHSHEIAEMKQYLADTYGFAPESIEEEHDHFVVEGDQRFDMCHFWENFAYATDNEFMVDAAQQNEVATDRRHYRWSYLVTNSNNVLVTVLPNVPQVWRTAITKAVSDWNALNGRLKFSIQYRTTIQNGTVNISMNTTYLDPIDYAIADYPTSNGYPGREIHINPAYNSEAALNANGKVGVIAHEIGHTLGIRHTDSGQGSLITNVSTTCRNNTDRYSVMSAQGSFYYGFTVCDKEAYKALYPK